MGPLLNQTASPANWKLAFVAFTSGAVLMSMELSGSRLVAPFLGSSLYVWTSLIGVILGFLSLGYFYGGRLADRRPEVIGWVLLTAGASLIVVPLVEVPLLYLLSRSAVDLRFAAFCAAILLFAVPSFLLGAVTPLAIRLAIGSLNKYGETVGLFFAISTLGSIFGTFVSGFFLFSFLSTSILLEMLAAILLLLAFFIQPSKMYIPATALVIALCGAHLLHTRIDQLVLRRGVRILDTRYHRVIVQDVIKDDGRIYRALITDPLAAQSSTYLDEPDSFTSKHGRFYDLGIYMTGASGSYLMLGGGAMSYPKYFAKTFPKAALAVVEIDPELIDISKKYFGFTLSKNLTVHTMDARRFLLQNTQKHKVIFMDAFKSSPEIPFHLTTEEFFRLCRSRLENEGLFLLNAIGSAQGPSAVLAQSLHKTLKNVFPVVKVFLVSSPKKPNKIQNIIFMAGIRPFGSKWELAKNLEILKTHEVNLPLSADAVVLRDEYAPVESLMSAVYRKRQKSRKRKINLQIPSFSKTY